MLLLPCLDWIRDLSTTGSFLLERGKPASSNPDNFNLPLKCSRQAVFSQILTSLGKTLATSENAEEVTVSCCFIACTDSKMINMLNERPINLQKPVVLDSMMVAMTPEELDAKISEGERVQFVCQTFDVVLTLRPVRLVAALLCRPAVRAHFFVGWHWLPSPCRLGKPNPFRQRQHHRRGRLAFCSVVPHRCQQHVANPICRRPLPDTIRSRFAVEQLFLWKHDDHLYH